MCGLFFGLYIYVSEHLFGGLNRRFLPVAELLYFSLFTVELKIRKHLHDDVDICWTI